MVDFIQNNRGMNRFLEKCEDYADVAIRNTRRYLPHIARFCLIATFIEDGFRLVTQFSDQVSYIADIWNTNHFLSGIFILLNIFTQFSGGFLIMGRYRVDIGCYLLVLTIVLQTIGYLILTRIFFIRNVSLCGSLLLLLAETKEEKRSPLAGLPTTGDSASRTYLLLGGRVLVVLMFLTLVDYSGSIFYLALSGACLALIIMVAVGFKTKLCCIILIVLLNLINFTYNSFWLVRNNEAMWDYLKYDFFQTLSVIGGLCLIVAYGPGGVSVDDYKKKW